MKKRYYIVIAALLFGASVAKAQAEPYFEYDSCRV